MPPQFITIVAPDAAQAQIRATLRKFGRRARDLAGRFGIRIVAVDGREYADASPAIRRHRIAVDAMPTPPAGLFVVEEKTVYLRSYGALTVAHEFGHAIDCALGGGVYFSGLDPRVRAAFQRAHTFVTPYAASGLDEYFAESLRAYLGVNDPHSVWPAVTRARLIAIDRPIYDVLRTLHETRL